MEVFVAVVELGGLTAAANYFRITPAMISRHLADLERRLGAALLNRTTRSQHLTEVGEQYFEKCKNILRQIADIEAGAEESSVTPKGLLRVSAPISFGSTILAPAIGAFLNQHPEVNLQLALADRFVDVVNEGFDVAVRVGALEDSSLVARRITSFEVAICAAPEYIARAGQPKIPADLIHHCCLDFTNWSMQGGWKALRKNSNFRSQTPRFEADNAQALLGVALQGIGIIMMPKALLKAELEAGRLIPLLESYTPAPRPIHAVYPKARSTARKVTSFVDFLADFLRPL
jgi:DNA-binding transcriptional LysR family regulator